MFVPTDHAFALLGEDTVNGFSSSQLQSIIEYHIVDGFIMTAMVGSPTNYSTLLGDELTIAGSTGVSSQCGI